MIGYDLVSYDYEPWPSILICLLFSVSTISIMYHCMYHVWVHVLYRNSYVLYHTHTHSVIDSPFSLTRHSVTALNDSSHRLPKWNDHRRSYLGSWRWPRSWPLTSHCQWRESLELKLKRQTQSQSQTQRSWRWSWTTFHGENKTSWQLQIRSDNTGCYLDRWQQGIDTSADYDFYWDSSSSTFISTSLQLSTL